MQRNSLAVEQWCRLLVDFVAGYDDLTVGIGKLGVTGDGRKVSISIDLIIEKENNSTSSMSCSMEKDKKHRHETTS